MQVLSFSHQQTGAVYHGYAHVETAGVVSLYFFRMESEPTVDAILAAVQQGAAFFVSKLS